eukprot:gene17959-27643_t
MEAGRIDEDTWSDPSAQKTPRSEALSTFQVLLNSLTTAMGEGTMARWIDQHSVEGITYVVAPQLDSTETDMRAYGKADVLAIYNAFVETRFPAPVTWKLREEARQLTSRTFRVDIFSKDGSAPSGETRERMYFSMANARVNFMMKCPQVPNDVSKKMLQEAREICAAIEDPTVGRPPCPHNSWDSVRGRQACTVLRCRECSVVWKIKARQLQDWRCCDFLRGCPFPPGVCRRVHVHARKARRNDTVVDGFDEWLRHGHDTSSGSADDLEPYRVALLLPHGLLADDGDACTGEAAPPASFLRPPAPH